MKRILPLLGCLLLGLTHAEAGPMNAPFPAEHRQLKRTISYDEMTAFLKSVERPSLITVTEEGRSVGGRVLFLVRLNRGGAKARFRAFLYAQQHGNEISGKDAQLYLVRAIAEHPELLPEDLDLYLMPMVNPDGAVSDRRTNDAKADLNRDHILLAQPETQILDRIARRILPHLAVDSHEFTRDGKEYEAKGLDVWPIITLDGLNHPLFPAYLRAAALERVASAGPVMAKAGHAYARYTLGGPPPDEEIRPSTTEVDDGRHSLGSLGALSFIIEAGVRRGLPDPQIDLGQRVDAYLTLYWHLLGNPSAREEIRELSERARREPLPPFLATNFFWANLDGKTHSITMRDRATGQPVEIASPNVMFDLVVKSSVPTPKAYVLEARSAGPMKALLERHGIRFEVLSAAMKLNAERCRLLRVEEGYDEIYQRYPHRQIVVRDAAAEREFPAGSLLVPLDQPMARRAVSFLEPCMLYGLFSYPEFSAMAAKDGSLPVWRLR